MSFFRCLLCLMIGAEASRVAADPLSLTAIAAGRYTKDGATGTILFAADAANGCVYRWQQADRSPGDRRETGAVGREISAELQRYDCPAQPSAPTALAYRDGLLYVADSAALELSVIDVWGNRKWENRQILWRGAPLRRPTDVAVSPEGLIVLADEGLGALIWLRADQSPIVQTSELWQAPARLTFTSGTLNVVDRSGALFSVPYRAEAGGNLQFLPPRQLRPQIGEGRADSIALASHRDIVYLDSGGRLYAYVPEPKETVPAYPEPAPGLRASRLTATTESLFLLSGDGRQLWQLERPVPAEVRLELAPAEANRVLSFLYRYLSERDLLPVRPVQPGGGATRFDRLLVSERAFVGNPRPGQPIVSGPAAGTKGMPPNPVSPTDDFLCRPNSALCQALAPGTDILALAPTGEVKVPDVPIRSVVKQTLVDLAGRSVAETLDELLPSRALRDRYTDLKPLADANQKRAGALDPGRYGAAFAALRQGTLELPAEAWEMTIPVFAADLHDPKSALRYFAATTNNLFLLSKESAEVRQRGFSLAGDVVPPAPDACAELRANRDRIARATHYKEVAGLIRDSELTIGIVEKSEKVDMGHLAFSSPADNPIWMRSVEQPPAEPETVDHPFSGGPPVLWTNDPPVASDFQDPFLWHGSHVAGIIAARDDCGSGLLPRAKLSLIHADSFDEMGKGILNAPNTRIRVVNVSQGAQADGSLIFWEDLHKTISSRPSMLFVFAAGDDSKDLNLIGAFPPVNWSRDLSNVVVVTATNTADQLLGEMETNSGKFSGVDTGSKYVDLAAVGGEVYSATTQNRYASSSGASQAAPQVAAAAAVLLEGGRCATPEHARARLIATADWRDQFGDLLWGGRLNFAKALFEPGGNVLTLLDDDQRYRVEFKDEKKISIEAGVGAQIHQRGHTNPKPPYLIFFSRILSIQPMFQQPPGQNRFRIVFVNEEGQVRILLNAELKASDPQHDKLHCTASRWNPDTSSWEPKTELCGQVGLDVSRITEYYRSCLDYGSPTFD
jgi:hypothetical protein